MRRGRFVAAGMCVLLSGILCASIFAAEAKKAETTVTGYVTDSMCKGDGAKEGHRDCALKCAREKGAKLGIWDSTASKFYALADQKKAEEFAGEKVTVKGMLDEATGTLEATSITRAGKKS